MKRKVVRMNAIIETNWTQPPPRGTNSYHTDAQMNVIRLNTSTRTEQCAKIIAIYQHAIEYVYVFVRLLVHLLIHVGFQMYISNMYMLLYT